MLDGKIEELKQLCRLLVPTRLVDPFSLYSTPPAKHHYLLHGAQFNCRGTLQGGERNTGRPGTQGWRSSTVLGLSPQQVEEGGQVWHFTTPTQQQWVLRWCHPLDGTMLLNNLHVSHQQVPIATPPKINGQVALLSTGPEMFLYLPRVDTSVQGWNQRRNLPQQEPVGNTQSQRVWGSPACSDILGEQIQVYHHNPSHQEILSHWLWKPVMLLRPVSSRDQWKSQVTIKKKKQMKIILQTLWKLRCHWNHSPQEQYNTYMLN